MPIHSSKIIALSLLLTFGVNQISYAGIAFDAVASNFAGAGSSSVSFSHTCTGANQVLIVGVDADGTTTSGVTYNSVAMTVVNTQAYGIGSETSLWYLKAPTTGANTIAVTLAGSSSGVQAGSVSLTDVDQTNPVDASAANSGTSTTPSVSVTTVNDNAWVVDVVGQALGGLTMTVGGSQTQRWNRAEITGGAGGSTLGPITPAGATSMSWTFTTSTGWGHNAVSLKPLIITSTDDPTLLLMNGAD